jgi:hypothetical protein
MSTVAANNVESVNESRGPYASKASSSESKNTTNPCGCVPLTEEPRFATPKVRARLAERQGGLAGDGSEG